ncbi:NAD(P)H-dependent flavin oxidoreductase [Nocardioides deserti]|uniref:Nitronate monooxygenase n=1 Tax=Nocardioides deserti TaxID=1588644 RepID=A0ABR6U7E6_9ACTN|nr:nitronate monooxygenase [Nocardioides deserti]MBC2960063.1 nitronate monooxygenase [Nocardioides deserti]GGO75041.1 putative monooxygenase [Nocardioides deserti]
MRTAFTEMVGVRHPLVGFSRSPGVVAAVSRAGGLGVFAASPYRPEELDAQLAWIEEQAGGRPYGVDLLVPPATEGGADLLATLRAQIPERHVRFVQELLARYGIEAPDPTRGNGASDDTVRGLSPEGVHEILDVTFAHRVALVANGLGTPPRSMLDGGRAHGVPVASLVGAGKHARAQLDLGVDVLVAQGTEAGGHTGTIATMVLTPEVVDLAGGVPVLAAGGIADGRQMAAALALGASGAWCGSVWLNSHEDVTTPVVKQKLVEATSADTVRSRSRTGKPARQLRSAWHDAWDGQEAPEPLPMQQQLLLAKDAWAEIDRAAETGSPGARELESFFVGQVVGAFGELRSAERITEEIVAGCERRLAELARLLG